MQLQLITSKLNRTEKSTPRWAPGQFYNLTRGYIKIRGDTCVGGDAKLYEPHKVACPIKEEKEFLLLAGRTQIQRIDLSNLTYPEILPINTSNVITVVCN